jgi:hypothetical protein
VTRHIEDLVDQLQQIIEQGNAQGIFHVTDTRASAKAVLNATSRLHHPGLVAAAHYPSEEDARYLINMIVTALKFGEP